MSVFLNCQDYTGLREWVWKLLLLSVFAGRVCVRPRQRLGTSGRTTSVKRTGPGVFFVGGSGMTVPYHLRLQDCSDFLLCEPVLADMFFLILFPFIEDSLSGEL